MLLKTEGIVLHITKYGESSLITKLFTKEKGVVSIISSRSKSNKNQIFQVPFALVNTICYFKPKSAIHRLKEIQFDSQYQEDSSHVIKNAVRYFIAELLNNLIREEEQNLVLYAFLKEKCLRLNQENEVSPSFLIDFMVGLSEPLGFFPSLSDSNTYFDLLHGEFLATRPAHADYLNEEDSRLCFQLFANRGTLNRLERKKALNHLLQFYSIQLDQTIKLKSKDVLEVVFS